ncbi:Do family serine endopeptidase [Sphingomonas rubra]|uniref:Probable periplasmic serine endoprotease DegP-like n=1 Tax=Sphingomonas rubra TaxID=634430 RepID=A0A1I5U2Q6_9SPHN|nr:Do family serine endopeptidase [Sphingomonas rubra]SFP89117.1 serine protease Do [Sphingomonas rubra]
MRNAYALTGALLLGGATATLALQPSFAQTAQNEPGAIQAQVPRAGAPMSFADMVAKLQPAVVNISTRQTITQQTQANPFSGTPFEGLFGGQGGGGGAPTRRQGASLGSGFIISSDGYVVTNNHVVAPGAKGATVDSITVTLPDRKEYTAKLIGRDEDSDLALLKIDATGLPFVRFGDSARARVGDWIVAIGNPFGLGGTVTAGIVSAVHRSSELGPRSRFIQTDAAINQGNSGGPMFDLNGNVIGINSQILGSQAGGNIGIGFAIPAEDAKPIIDALMKGQAIKRGYIGIGLGGPVDTDVASALGIPPNRGELVASVEPSGPAAKAGLRAGDVVTKVNGTDVTPDATLAYLVAAVAPGQNARLDVLRNGRPQTINVGVVNRPTNEQLSALAGGDSFDPNADGDSPAAGQSGAATLGLSVQPLTPGIARTLQIDPSIAGVVVAQASPTTDAGQKLKRGDVISQVNGEPVRTGAEFAAAVTRARAAGRPQVLLRVTRQRATAFLAVRLAN